MTAIKTGSMAVRIAGVITLALGVFIWVGADSAAALRPVHMLAGIVVAVSLLALAVHGLRAGVPVLPVVAIVWALILPVFGMTQASMTFLPHVLIQVAHLAAGVVAIGLGEMIAMKASGSRGTMAPAA